MLTLSATSVKGQSSLEVKYVDDRINESTYLDFKSDQTFEYHYLYDSMGDAATGTYWLHRDTIFLKYAPDASDLKERFITHTKATRADTLLIKGNLLYEVKNGVSREYEPRDTVHYKPPRNWHYRRKYILFGFFQSPRYSKHYMIEERYAKWKHDASKNN